ncbi:hypothetical protein DVH05_016010 [Phytophthora capsici]|nr:hypothetical protein DVH05_016010 [Phytophthora capsici]|eukprot:jgi/Phyca11/549871/estExt2_Genewise1Plus.C_PHYCAscaffold_340153
MRRPKRSTPRLHWMAAASPGDRSPMDILMSWLERNGEEYRQSKRKIQMIEQLCEDMAMNGIYGLSIATVRSQLCRLKNGVQMIAEGRSCNSMDVNRYYDQLLLLLFDDNERAQMRERAAAEAQIHNDAAADPEPEPKAITEAVGKANKRGAEVTCAKLQSDGPILDTTEIRRRFELLCARQELQQRGIDPETIDTFLPLSHK